MVNNLKKKEDKFRYVFEQARQPYIILQHNGYIYEMNAAARKVFSLTEEDRPLYSSVYIKPGLPARARKAMENFETYSFESAVDFDKLRYLLPDIRGNGAIDLKIKMTPLGKDGAYAAGDYLLEILPKDGYSQNETPQPFNMDNVPFCRDAVLFCLQKGEIRQANEAAVKLFNLDAAKLKGKNIFDFFNSKSDIAQSVKALYEGIPFVGKEYELLLKGVSIAVEADASLAGNGGFFILLCNIAAKKQLNDLLAERASRLDALFKVNDAALLECDIKDNVFSVFTNANAKALTLSGLGRKDLFSISLTDMLTDKEQKERKKVLVFLAAKSKQLERGDLVSFNAKLRIGDKYVPALVRIVSYPAANGFKAFIILRDTSKERILESELDYKAKELAGIKDALPGLYLKVDKQGIIQEYKTADLRYNIAVFPNDFVGKNPSEYLDKETVERYLHAISEVIKTGVSASGNFTVRYGAENRLYEAAISRIKGEDNVIVLVNMSDRRKSLENKIHELYAISSNREAGFVKNMDDILEFGKEIFGADVGLISHFSGAHRAKILINYATSNDFGIEKDIETPVEECYSSVRGGQIFACSDTSQLGCKNCLHINKNITSMLSAPLKIAGRVEGAITFLTVTPNQMLIMEEDINFMGFIGGLMGMALELRSAKKAVDSGLSTLKKLISSLDVPCVITDTSLRIKNANDIMLRICGAHDIVEVEEKNIFMRFAADDAKAHMRFISAHKSSRGGIFDTDFDLMLANSKTQNIVWHIVEINDSKNSLKGFLFVGESVKDLPAVRGLLADGPSMHA